MRNLSRAADLLVQHARQANELSKGLAELGELTENSIEQEHIVQMVDALAAVASEARVLLTRMQEQQKKEAQACQAKAN